MKKGLTELVLIIESSSSMNGLETELVNGFNTMLSEQQKINGDVVLTTIFNNDITTVLHNRINLSAAAPLTTEDIITGGESTQCNAIDLAIHKTYKAISGTKQDYRPEKVLFVILKSGSNTSNCQYSSKLIKERIASQREKGWEFILFITTESAASQADALGISKENTKCFSLTAKGVTQAYAVMSEVISEYRNSCCTVTDEYKEGFAAPADIRIDIPFDKIQKHFTELRKIITSLQTEMENLGNRSEYNDIYERLKTDTSAVTACCNSVLEEYELLLRIARSTPDKSYVYYAEQNMRNVYQQLVRSVSAIIDRSNKILVIDSSLQPYAKTDMLRVTEMNSALQICLDNIADIYGIKHIGLNRKPVEIPSFKHMPDIKNTIYHEHISPFKRLIKRIFKL